MIHNNLNLIVDDSWFVKLPGKRIVDEVIIRDISRETVLIELTDDKNGLAAFLIELTTTVRYVIKDIEWIEQKP